jgi:hypothetical protein
MSKGRIQKKRIVIWTKEDRQGNEVAFASIDLRAAGDGFTDDQPTFEAARAALPEGSDNG